MENNLIQKNTALNVIKTISKIIFPMVTFLYASRVLHAESLGKIKFANSIVNYISLIAALGISTYAIRECSKVKEDKDRLSDLSSQLFTINVITTIISYVILGIVLIFCPDISDYRNIILIQSGVVVFTTLGADWLNMALEDFHYITIRTFLSQLIALLLVFIFVRSKDDYLVYAIILMLAASGGDIANILYRKKYCKVVFPVKVDIKRHLKPIIFLFSMSLAQNIYVNVDSTMLGLMRSNTEVGIYSASVNIYNIINQVVASIAFVVMPSMSILFAKKDYKEINKLLSYSFAFIVIVGLPCITGTFVIAKELLCVIGGIEYIVAATSLRILCIALLGSFLAGFLANIIMLPSGREKLCLISSIISAAVNFVLNIFLIPKYGIAAAALTTAISQWIGFFVKLPFVEKEIKLNNTINNIKSAVIGCILIILYLIGVKQIFDNFYLIAFTGILGSIIIYVFVLIKTQNKFVLDILQKIKRSSLKNV